MFGTELNYSRTEQIPRNSGTHSPNDSIVNTLIDTNQFRIEKLPNPNIMIGHPVFVGPVIGSLSTWKFVALSKNCNAGVTGSW